MSQLPISILFDAQRYKRIIHYKTQRDIAPCNMIDLDVDISWSLRVKCNGAVWLLICDLPLVFNRSIWPSLAPLCDTGLQILHDFDFALSRSRKVISDAAVRLPICDLISVLANNTLTQLIYEIYNFEIWMTFSLTFQGHSRSNLMVQLDSSYMISC